MNPVLYDWPFPTVAAGLVGLVVLIVWPRPPGAGSRWRDPSWLVCLMLPVYMIHQFEEHGFNVFGQRFHFMNDLCEVLGFPDLTGCPASPAFICAVNCGGVWIAGLLAIALRRRNVLVGACALGVPLINIVAHIGPALFWFRYNSGLLTALVLFVPLCAWSLVQLRRAGVLDGARLVAVPVSGVLVHAVLAASVFAREYGVIGEGALVAINILNGFVPLTVAVLFARVSPATHAVGA